MFVHDWPASERLEPRSGVGARSGLQVLRHYGYAAYVFLILSFPCQTSAICRPNNRSNRRLGAILLLDWKPCFADRIYLHPIWKPDEIVDRKEGKTRHDNPEDQQHAFRARRSMSPYGHSKEPTRIHLPLRFVADSA